jgi:hypothetical protein
MPLRRALKTDACALKTDALQTCVCAATGAAAAASAVTAVAAVVCASGGAGGVDGEGGCHDAGAGGAGGGGHGGGQRGSHYKEIETTVLKQVTALKDLDCQETLIA